VAIISSVEVYLENFMTVTPVVLCGRICQLPDVPVDVGCELPVTLLRQSIE
jgi:hypothetical protein